MTQGYLTDPATRHNIWNSEFTPFPSWADEGFETVIGSFCNRRFGYKAGQGKSCPNSVRGRKSRTPARFTTFDTAIYPKCNPQSGAATLRGRTPLVRRPRFNKCARTGDSSPKETGVLGRFPGKTPL